MFSSQIKVFMNELMIITDVFLRFVVCWARRQEETAAFGEAARFMGRASSVVQVFPGGGLTVCFNHQTAEMYSHYSKC